MEQTAVTILLLLFYGPWPLVALWASLRFRRKQSAAMSAATGLLRIAAFIVIAFVLLVVAAFSLFVWANVAADKPVFALIAHLAALVPAFWVTRYRLELPLVGRTRLIASVLFFVWLAFWIPVFAFFVFAVIYEAF